MRTLLYLASGQYRPVYEELDFDKIILVDKSMRLPADNRPENSKVELIKADALTAIKRLKRRRNLKIDCLVSVNEGLSEGGGDYPIFSDFLLGFLSPILSDELLVITDIDYYGVAQIKTKVAKMDWGFTATKVLKDDPWYIRPEIFTTYSNTDKPDYGDVLLLVRNKSQQTLHLNSKLEINLVYGSIWEDEKQLGLIGFKLKPRSRSRKIDDFFQKEGVYDITNKSIEEILLDAEEKKVAHLGLTPWMNGNYEHVISVLRNYEPHHLKKITFYHLRKKDFQMLYQQAAPMDNCIDI